MNMSRIAGVAALLVIAGCGGSPAAEVSEEPSPSPHAAEPAVTASAGEVATRLEGAVSSVTKTVVITEDNDPNDDIGRPGLYQEAVSIYDSRSKCDSPLDISCGAKVEVFADSAGAKARMEYIQSLVKAASGLITEYDYVDGSVLLRVSGNLKPSEAKEYEASFAGKS